MKSRHICAVFGYSPPRNADDHIAVDLAGPSQVVQLVENITRQCNEIDAPYRPARLRFRSLGQRGSIAANASAVIEIVTIGPAFSTYVLIVVSCYLRTMSARAFRVAHLGC
jgi:hypothetical protein